VETVGLGAPDRSAEAYAKPARPVIHTAVKAKLAAS
jgi:hypothetical protein